jgi:hypothetical protein
MLRTGPLDFYARLLGRPVTYSGPRLRLDGLCFPVLGGRVRHQGVQQVLGDVGDFVHSRLEGILIGLGRLGAATDLADILQGGCVHFLGGGVRFVVVEGSNVPAHMAMLGSGTLGIDPLPALSRAVRPMGSALWAAVPIDSVLGAGIGSR